MLLKSALLLALSVCRASANGQAPLHGDEDSQIPLSFPDNVQQQQPLASIGNSGGSGNRPNIVFILTDDQDLHMQSLDYMPLVKKHLIDQGTFFKRHFCTIAICCPSRVSLWTGRAAHNTNVTDVNPPYGMTTPDHVYTRISYSAYRRLSKVFEPGFQRSLFACLVARRGL